jgi:hypothetical protein
VPRAKGRGKVVRTRTVKVGKGKYKVCDVYSKSGPRGGKTVCGPTKKKKKKS